MDDDFWWKLNEDDDYTAMFGEIKLGNGYKAKTKKNSTESKKQSDAKVIPVQCNIEDYSNFNKTKTGRVLYGMLLVLPILIYLFLVLAVIFGVLERVITFLFVVLFVLSFGAYFYIIKLRNALNRTYRQSLVTNKNLKDKNTQENNKNNHEQ